MCASWPSRNKSIRLSKRRRSIRRRINFICESGKRYEIGSASDEVSGGSAGRQQCDWRVDESNHSSKIRDWPRPEGPTFNSHVRKGVDRSASKEERRRCGRKLILSLRKECRPFRASRCLYWLTSTPLRTWLLSAGPSGLKARVRIGPSRGLGRKLLNVHCVISAT